MFSFGYSRHFLLGAGEFELFPVGGLVDNAPAIYYFETVDNKVFACCKKEVYEVREKLYTLEGMLPVESFMRASKSAILNLNKVKSLSPAFGGRFEAVLDNGEKTIISRQYVPVLKETAWIVKEV